VWPETYGRAELELGLLRRLLVNDDDLLTKVRVAEPNRTEVLALASILHSFYTGIENIFNRIAEEIDGSTPTGPRYHADLLEQMARPSPQRPAVISCELHVILGDYMGFRHMFRHAYSFHVKWDRMSSLVLHMEETLDRLDSELQDFFGTSSV
jgi:hypothetical protein